MGATYLARQISLDRLVALKVLKKSLGGDRVFVDRFYQEARLSGKLDHVNIVRVLNVGQSGGFHHLVMEYVEGRNLADRMAAEKFLPEKEALHIAVQVARALDHAHRHAIVHRDVKPANVMMDLNGIAKLCDFGLARQEDKAIHLTLTGMMIGTPHYVSPEQARGERDIDTRSDIYSLGATLYHLVTGQTPFDGSSAAAVMTKHITDQVPWPRDVNPAVSENCCRLITRMMAKNESTATRPRPPSSPTWSA